MEKEQVQKAIDELKKLPQKKFVQSYDLIINLKNIDTKQTQLDLFVTLPHSKGKKVTIAAFVDQQLAENALKNCDLVIKDTEFDKYREKKTIRKLAEDHDYFIAQASLMAKIASVFGKALGTKGKMPNPKLGCVVPPNANLELLKKKLICTVRLTAKKATNLQCLIGKQSQPDSEIINNILTVYNAVVKHVPNEHQNIKNVALKLSMSKPVHIEY